MISLIPQTLLYNPIENAIYKYENHPNVIVIKKHMKSTNSSFSFQTVTKENTGKDKKTSSQVAWKTPYFRLALKDFYACFESLKGACKRLVPSFIYNVLTKTP